MQIPKTFYKRLIISIFSLVIGVLLYYLFNNDIISKSNIFYTLIRNYFLDGLWVISFFFIAINFSKDITKKYILMTSAFVMTIGIIFEIMQLTNLAKLHQDY